MDSAASARPSAEDRIRAALWFAEHGFGIFSVWSATPDGVCRCPNGAACTSSGKHPITSRGFHDATRDAERIRTLLSAASQPNYGLVCPDGVFALDVDGEGVGRLAELEARYGLLPATLRTATAHGQHIFLRWPADLPRPLGHLFGFVTRWGSGSDAGYVIGPRSVHPSGVAYTPAGGAFEIAELPAAWAQAALGVAEEPTITIGGRAPLPEVGGRHDWLRDRARFYRGVLDDRAVVRAAMLAENARLAVPKSEAEVDRAIGNVFERFPADLPEVVEARVERRLGEDALRILGAPASDAFPVGPGAAAFEGLLGECVADIAPGTDASLVGLLGSLLAFCGALIPGQAYFHRTQTSSPFVALVGESSVGRKGTAMMRAQDAMASAIEPVYVNRVVLDGLNSGEALVSTLHYKREAFPYEPTVGLVFEEEYASLLASRGREGSTLDPKMRQAFDGGVLSNRRSGESKSVVPPYWLPALIAITPTELRLRLETGALQSGSANRWLYLPVVKRAIVPTNEEPQFAPERRTALAAARRWALDTPRVLRVEPGVNRTLAEYSDWLPGATHGVAHDLARRYSIIAFRIALVHALAERSAVVAGAHLRRGLALVEYARAGIGWVFGSTVGNADADLLLRHLRAEGRLRKTAITREIIRDPIRRQAAIDELVRLGLAVVVTTHPAGRGGVVTELVATPFSTHATDFPLSPSEDRETAPAVELVEIGPDSRSDAVELDGKSNGNRSAIDGNRSAVPEWLSPCLDYRAHQSSHRQTAAGWVCDACGPQS